MYVVNGLQLEQASLDLPQIKATAFVHVVLLEYRPDTVYTKCSHASVHRPQCPLTFCRQNARVPGLPFPEARSALGRWNKARKKYHVFGEDAKTMLPGFSGAYYHLRQDDQLKSMRMMQTSAHEIQNVCERSTSFSRQPE
jgi:hypothetical protein